MKTDGVDFWWDQEHTAYQNKNIKSDLSGKVIQTARF